MKILLVDDETELSEPLSRILLQEGYQVDLASNGAAGMELALKNQYDLLILDWMLPYHSGLEICREVRSRSLITPVLFLTAKDTVDARVDGLDAGADDYLVKPFELRELLARVRALLRRSGLDNLNSDRLKVADLELDLENQLAYRQGKGINLSEKEIKLLKYFMQHPDRLLTHEEIYDYLWQGEEQPSSNVLAALVRLLRRKIEVDSQTSLIHTVYGRGYRFGVN
ncbi:two component transcriptional regulator, winged helix family protein [Chondrocystis sp. NIES-4102]|nr:two component transcriptional regulator, winged helix family protein [Chondrocystis sp. NIES-4102]